MNREPVPETSGIQLSKGWGVGLLVALVAAAALINTFTGSPLSDFLDQVSEVGFWQALVDGASLAGAVGLLVESAIGAGAVVYAVGKFLGRSPGEWFVAFLLFLLAILAALITELLAILALTVTGPLLTLLIILILLGSLVAILIAALAFLGPLIVAGVNCNLRLGALVRTNPAQFHPVALGEDD